MLCSVTFTCSMPPWTWRCATGSSPALLRALDATLGHLHLRATRAWCCGPWSSLALLHFQFYMKWTLRSLLFPFSSTLTMHVSLMLGSMILTCMSTWAWCCAPWSSLACPHDFDTTLHDLDSQIYINWCYAPYPHFHANAGASIWTGCCALCSLVASLRELALRDLHLQFWRDLMLRLWLVIFILQFYMNVLLRSMIVTCSSTWTCRCAAWSSVAALHELDAALLAFACSSTWTLHATLYDPHLHVYMNLMLRCMVFTCNSSLNLGLTLRSRIFACFSMILACIPTHLDATHCDLHLRFFMNLMLRSMIFTWASTWTWFCALWSSPACLHDVDATLCDLHLRVSMNLTLRYMIFTRVAACTWCYAWISSLACYVNLMLRSMIFSCCSTLSVLHEIDATLFALPALPFQFHMSYALWSSLACLREFDSARYEPRHACLHELDAALHDLHSQLYINWCCALFPHFHANEFDATLYDLHWRFYMNCLLRSLFFSCQSSWTCAPWSALAVLNELDAMAMVSDLHLQFYMNVLLRSIIVTCSSTWTCCCAAWSSLAALHELDATLL